MKTVGVLLVALLFVVPAEAVVVTCVNEGGNVVRIDYSATDESVLPVAFALDVTVDAGAVITSVYDYKTGDSTGASRGFGIFPSSMQIDPKGLVGNWGRPDMSSSDGAGVQPGVGTSGVTLGMASRYSGRENAPLATGTLCRIRVDMRGAATVNVRVAQNVAGGGVVREDATPANFTGVGCILGSVTGPQPPQPPASLTYPSTSSTGQYTVSWPASTGATSYQLERSSNGGGTWGGVYSGSAISYAETVPNGTYQYRVRATNSGGSSLWRTSTVSCVVSISGGSSAPQAPASITYPSTSSTGQYTVSWAASTGATSYQLERSANGGSTWSGVYSGTALSYAQTVPNGAYLYRVRATNSAGSSAWRTGSGNCVVSIPPSTGTVRVGNTTVFSQISTTATRRAMPYTAPQAGQLQSVSIYHQAGSGQMILAVYADSSGRPGTRLGVTNATTVSSSQGWQTITLQSPVSVASGQRIWLAWVFQTNPGIRFTSGTPGRAESTGTWSGGMPSTFGTSTVANYIFSIYATYGAGTGGGTVTTKTVGNTTVFSGTATSLNRRAMPYTMPEEGDLRSISIYHQGGSGQMILAVYADNAGRPGTRLGVTAATTVRGTAGWQTITLPSPMSVNPGQRIWLAWVFQNSVTIRVAAGTPGRAEAGTTWTGGMPGTFGTSTVANYIYSIYATYEPDDD